MYPLTFLFLHAMIIRQRLGCFLSYCGFIALWVLVDAADLCRTHWRRVGFAVYVLFNMAMFVYAAFHVVGISSEQSRPWYVFFMFCMAAWFGVNVQRDVSNWLRAREAARNYALDGPEAMRQWLKRREK